MDNNFHKKSMDKEFAITVVSACVFVAIIIVTGMVCNHYEQQMKYDCIKYAQQPKLCDKK